MSTPDHDDGPRRRRVGVAVVVGLTMLVVARADLISVGHAAGLTVTSEKLTIHVVGNPP